MTNENNTEAIDETEAQLLQAMSVDEELPVYKAFAGKTNNNFALKCWLV